MENTTLVEINFDSAKEVSENANKMLLRCEGFVITTEPQFRVATTWLKDIKTIKAALTEKRQSMKKDIMDFFRAPESACDTAERVLKGSILTFQEELERKQREAQRKIDEEARRKAAAEEAKAKEKARQIEEEARAKAEALKKSGEAEKAAAVMQKAAEKAAAVSEKAEEKAADILASAPVIQSGPTKVEGISYKTVYDVEVVDASQVPDEFWIIDQGVLDKVAPVMHKAGKVIPGVKVTERKVVASRKS